MGLTLAITASSSVAAAASTAVASDNDALYACASAVLVALIGGVVAIITSNRKGETQTRYLDPPTSHALPQALSDLYEDALERAVKAEAEAAMWQERARAAGWQAS